MANEWSVLVKEEENDKEQQLRNNLRQQSHVFENVLT